MEFNDVLKSIPMFFLDLGSLSPDAHATNSLYVDKSSDIVRMAISMYASGSES